MSDIQNDTVNYNKMALKMFSSVFSLLILKWIIIIGLNRWARSIK